MEKVKLLFSQEYWKNSGNWLLALLLTLCSYSLFYSVNSLAVTESNTAEKTASAEQPIKTGKPSTSDSSLTVNTEYSNENHEVASLNMPISTMPTPVNTITPTLPDLLTFVGQWRQYYQIPAVVVTVSRKDQPAHTYLMGDVDLAQKKPISADSLFAIGSITKTFISALILQLAAQKKLSLDDPVTKWLPQYLNWDNITIRQLLNMTSGIVRYTEDEGFLRARKEDAKQHWTAEQLVTIAYQHPNYFKPGTNWQYSNTNYLILGLIIEKVTDRPLAWVIQRNLIQPLKLMHTYYISTTIPPALMPLMAHGYQEDKDVTGNDFSVLGASGSIISNTLDMTTWIRALFTKLLPKKQLTDLTTVYHYTEPSQPPGSAYGLGIFSLEVPQYGTIWWYTGLIEGYSSLLVWIPSQEIAIAVTINRLANHHFMLLFPQEALFQFLLNYAGTGR
jgi:D-alanyl-D-alanine carboxypeptidase